MFRSQRITAHLMEREEATDWKQVYQQYMKRLHDEGRLAEMYLMDLHKMEGQQPLTAAGIMRLLRNDSMVDIIVGGTDGKLHLLHNLQMVEENGTFLVAGISGRSFSAQFQQIEVPTSTKFFETTEKWMPIHSGERGAQLWINEQLTELDPYHRQREDSIIQQEGSQPTSLWLQRVKYWVSYYLPRQFAYLWPAPHDGEEDVEFDTREKVYEVFPMADSEESFQAVTFFLCPTFFTAYLLSTRQTEYGMEVNDLQEDAKTASTIGLAWWIDRNAYPLTYPTEVAWNAQAYIKFQSTWDKFLHNPDYSEAYIYQYPITPVSSERNALLMSMAGRRNGISILADIHVEDKENLAFYGNE